MAGIYIHIPFCAKKCFYCDFFTVQSQKNKDTFIEALLNEIEQRSLYLNNEIIETIYIGGGTPSLIKYEDLQKIFGKLYALFDILDEAEITIEVNPDDISEHYLQNLKNTLVNRFSIGIQSFFDDDLQLMNRRHTRKDAFQSIGLVKEFGYENISIDLIYGLPNLSKEKWEQNLDLFFEQNIPHLSAYHLTYEPKTVFFKYLKSGKIKALEDEESLKQFQILRKKAKENNFIHYETSNFAKEANFSKHNSNYWRGKMYLGLGPAAHSYDLISRQYNVSNLKKYIEGVHKKNGYFEKEILSETDKYNDYVITNLRTVRGIDLNFIKNKLGMKFYDFAIRETKKLISENKLQEKKGVLSICYEAKFTEDSIVERLFFLD